jgi:hypothetical protein
LLFNDGLAGMVGPDRIELSTNWLKASCSTAELRTLGDKAVGGRL